jgi:hypothetical protein
MNDPARPQIPVPDQKGPTYLEGYFLRYPKCETSPKAEPIPTINAPAITMKKLKNQPVAIVA